MIVIFSRMSLRHLYLSIEPDLFVVDIVHDGSVVRSFRFDSLFALNESYLSTLLLGQASSYTIKCYNQRIEVYISFDVWYVKRVFPKSRLI